MLAMSEHRGLSFKECSVHKLESSHTLWCLKLDVKGLCKEFHFACKS